VVAVDVGYGQLAWSVQSHERVTVRDRTNVRELTAEEAGDPPPGLIVADLSFISLVKVIPALTAVAAEDADLVLMVKPQFEVGKANLPAGAVVRNPALRAQAVRSVAAAGTEAGLGIRGVTASPLPGPRGYVEYRVWLARGAGPLDEADLQHAIESGPQ
jgi:23S rRNA (cytidine1920-2'-O)/16S rRNA (cytidine1409-2'-O)-methyltransferase